MKQTLTRLFVILLCLLTVMTGAVSASDGSMMSSSASGETAEISAVSETSAEELPVAKAPAPARTELDLPSAEPYPMYIVFACVIVLVPTVAVILNKKQKKQ